MKNTIQELETIVVAYAKKFSDMPDDVFSAKPFPNKWSKKEVLGHLVDSAQNNQRRFICSQYESQPPVIVYQQDFWVACNQYQRMPKAAVIDLWRLMNQTISAVLDSMPEENYGKECNTGRLHTLQWIAGDYVKHMKHHINQIVPGSFDVIYP